MYRFQVLQAKPREDVQGPFTEVTVEILGMPYRESPFRVLSIPGHPEGAALAGKVRKAVEGLAVELDAEFQRRDLLGQMIEVAVTR